MAYKNAGPEFAPRRPPGHGTPRRRLSSNNGGCLLVCESALATAVEAPEPSLSWWLESSN